MFTSSMDFQPRSCAIAGHQLAPADLARLARIVRGHIITDRLEQGEKRSLRIGDHRETAHLDNVLGPVVHLAPEPLGQRRLGVHVLHLDVPHPVRRRARPGRLLGKLHHAAERALTARPHDVRAALPERLGLPPHDLSVKRDGRLGILGE
jgi:hypothetical protein